MKLTEQIALALRRAQINRGNHQTLPLKQGLTLILYVDTNGENHLLAFRTGGVYPSEQEMITVMRHWPQQPAPVLEGMAPNAEAPALIAYRRDQAGAHNGIVIVWKPNPPAMAGAKEA